MRAFGLTCLLLFSLLGKAQQTLKAVVADSSTKQPLSFATVKAARENKAVIAGINGQFSLTLKEEGMVQISYSGHRSKQVLSSTLKETDTVFLSALPAVLDEVVIQSQNDKIRRIVNAAVAAKALNNPDRYAQYECKVYYKMKVDVETYDKHKRDSFQKFEDSLFAARAAKRKKEDTATADTSRRMHFALPSHLFLTETYSRRLYKHPGQVQELVLASRVSGLRKTYFANVVTDILPFHIYTDYISLNGMDFINPIASGWQGRYHFALEDEIVSDNDTVFMLRYAPKKGTSFNALTGIVYISSNGFAVTHFTGSNAVRDSISKRFVRFEHIYSFVNGKWFPQELNYNFGIRDFPEPYTQLFWNGHSRIDSVSFNPPFSVRIDKAHPLKFSDSVDLHTDEDWVRYRADSLSLKERNTYRNLDSVAKASHVDAFILGGLRAATGRIPFGKLDLDLQRIIASNEYEGTRLGLGLYTNNRVSKYYSAGGWWGYGFKDKAAKYGASFTLFPKGDKENWLQASYQKNHSSYRRSDSSSRLVCIAFAQLVVTSGR